MAKENINKNHYNNFLEKILFRIVRGLVLGIILCIISCNPERSEDDNKKKLQLKINAPLYICYLNKDLDGFRKQLKLGQCPNAYILSKKISLLNKTILDKNFEYTKELLKHKSIFYGHKYNYPTLNIIAAKGYFHLFKYLNFLAKKGIILKVDYNRRSKNCLTPIWYAFYNSNFKTFFYLLKSGAYADPIDFKYRSLLYVALENNKITYAKFLMKYGANPNITLYHPDISEDKNCVIDLIIRKKLYKFYLWAQKADLKGQLEHGFARHRKVFYKSILDDNLTLFKLLLPIEVEYTPSIYMEVIIRCSNKKKHEKFSTYVLKNMNINFIHPKLVDNLIHKLCRHNKLEIFKQIRKLNLLEELYESPNWNLKNKKNESPLYLCYKYKNYACFKFLLSEKVDTEQKIQKHNVTLLLRAIKDKNIKYIIDLLPYSKILYHNFEYLNGDSPILFLVRNGDKGTLGIIEKLTAEKILKPEQVDLELENSKGESALYIAYKTQNLLMFTYLLGKGANPRRLISKYYKPIEIVIEDEIKQEKETEVNSIDYSEIAEKLLKNYFDGANISNNELKKYKNDKNLYLYIINKLIKIKDYANRPSYQFIDNTFRNSYKDGDGLKDIASWYQKFPFHISNNIKLCNKIEKINKCGHNFYRQANSPTCVFNSLGRVLALKYGDIEKSNYCVYILSTLYYMHKNEVDDLCNKYTNNNSSLKDQPFFKTAMCKIKELSKKLKFKADLLSKKPEYTEEYVEDILKLLVKVKTLFQKNKGKKLKTLDNYKIYTILDLVEFEMYFFENKFSSILRVIRCEGMYLSPKYKNPDLIKLNSALDLTGLKKNINFYGHETISKKKFLGDIKYNIDSGKALVGGFFYGIDTEDKHKDFHAMTIIGYCHDYGVLTGVFVTNTWCIKGKYYGYFTIDKLFRCMRKFDGNKNYFEYLTLGKNQNDS